ncbi:hypothetical protein MLD38_002593 [Melastoma candidum]|uniref:Uncharacterized protein n=1 Tax=Melastoma candidum TaxID=119954 RepID=A0ACB9RZV4_9MYRT|nr:hypothetical protein MLD38_002593 [Melastoma candidum]
MKTLNPRPPKPHCSWVADSPQMASLDNHRDHDGYRVQSSCEREVLDIEVYDEMDVFGAEDVFRCEDDDIMVEVLGSDVYVDGICGRGDGNACFTAGLADDGEFDPNSWSHGAVGPSVEGSGRRRQGLEARARDTIKDTSGKEGSQTHRTNHTRKERSSADLMGNPEELLEASSLLKRHKVDDDPGITLGFEDEPITITMVEDITTSSSGSKPSGSLESNGEGSENGECALLNGFEIFVSETGDVQFPEHSSSDDLLEQLQFAAENPLVGHEESILHNRERSEIYQFADTIDSYWTDRVIATNPLDQPYYDYEGEMTNEDSRTLGKSDRLLSTAKESSTIESDCLLTGDNSPAELILIFPKTGSFPVAATLNKTLKMFGPLKESETQVDRKSNRARVVFRKYGDAKCHISLDLKKPLENGRWCES